MNSIQKLHSLYEAARSENTVNIATNELMDLFEQPETIFDHISLIKKCENIIIRKYASLMLSKLFKAHLQALSFDKVLLIQQSLLELIANDSDLYVRYFLCDSITIFLSVAENTPDLWTSFSANEQPWLNIFDLANQLVKTQDFLSTGLYLWRNIYSLFPYSGSNELLFALLSIITTSLSSSLENDRLQALNLLDHLRGCIPDQLGSESQATVVQTCLQSLLDELNYSIYIGYEDKEILLAIKVVAGFLDNPPPFLEFEHLSIFFELAFTVLTEKTIPMNTRFMVHRIIESSVDMIVDNYRDRLNTLIQISVELSLEVCDSQRDDTSYEFPFSFFYTIVDAYDSETEGIFELFLSAANALIQDGETTPAERQVALLIITSIVEGTQEIISERINDLIQFILQIADFDDQYVFSSFCDTLNELIQYVPVPISLYIEEISSFVLQNVAKYTNDAVMLLDNLFSKCERAPKDAEPVFNELNSLINQSSTHSDQVEMIISCILSLLLQLDSPEEYVSSFLPTLNKIYLSKTELKDVVFNFYGSIVSIAPNVVKNDLLNLTKSILSALESCEQPHDDANFQFFTPAALCLKQISRILPASLISMSVIQQATPFLLKMIELSDSDQAIDLSDDSTFKHAQTAAISCLFTFFGYLPNTIQECVQKPIVADLLSEYVPMSSIMIFESITDSVAGFHFLGIPLFDVITTSITKILMFTEKKEVIIKILTMLTEILRNYKTDLGKREDVLHAMISSIYQILTAPPLGFLKTEHSSFIDQQIQYPLFLYIHEFIIVLFEIDTSLSSTVLTNTFIPCILPYLKSYSSMMKGHAISALSAILFVLSMNIYLMRKESSKDEELSSSIQQLSEFVDNLLEIVSDAGFEFIDQIQNSENRRIIAYSFIFLVPIKRDFFADKLEILIPFAIEMIEFCGFTTLWSVLALCFSPPKEKTKEIAFSNSENNSVWDFIQFLLSSHLDEETETSFIFNMFDNLAVTVAVIDEIPGEIQEVSFEADFFFFIKDNADSMLEGDENGNAAFTKISALLDEKLPLIAVALFTSSDSNFQIASKEAKLACAQVISDMPQENLIELVNYNESKLATMKRHLKMIRAPQPSS